MDAKLLKEFKEIEKGIWELPKSYREGMRVPLRIIATEKLLREMDDGAVEQGINVASLPGIVGYSFMMPDAHWGYGFPIGGVAAFDLEEGVISPGGIGFDINCGMRLITTNLTEKEVVPRIKEIIGELFEVVPTGVGAKGLIRLTKKEFRKIMIEGASWAVESGFGFGQDLAQIEERGKILGADPEAVTEKAIARGINQAGTLGSGNHYLEIQRVEIIFEESVASELGILQEGQIVVMIHCGSRGFGHQIGMDYLSAFEPAMQKYGIKVPDRQLACLPIDSPEGKKYFSAMAAAANNAFCNRQIITHRVREVFSRVFKKPIEELEMDLVYDVAHNIAKIEEYHVSEAKRKKLLVHRKGATRAFPDQPVILGGSMETGSYLLIGTEKAMQKTFGSTAHGSGRTMSRVKAKRSIRGEELQKKMMKKGIYVKTASFSGLAEEAGFAYKDINEVVSALSLADISRPVASFKPIGNIKG